MPTDPSLPGTAPLSPNVAGVGLELSPAEWDDVIYGPLTARSAVMSLNIQRHQSYGPFTLPKMTAAPLGDAAWSAPDTAVAEVNLATGATVLLSRSVKALKCIPRIAAETIRSSVGSPLDAAQVAIVNEMTKVIDPALIQGNATAGITGLIAAAGDTITYGDSYVGNVFDALQDALTEALDNWARPTVWLMNTRSLGSLYKEKDDAHRPLIAPAMSAPVAPGGSPGQLVTEMLMGRRVIATPAVPAGTALLIDETQVHLGADLDREMRLLLEVYAPFDQVGFLIVSRWDIGVVNSYGVVVVDGLPSS